MRDALQKFNSFAFLPSTAQADPLWLGGRLRGDLLEIEFSRMFEFRVPRPDLLRSSVLHSAVQPPFECPDSPAIDTFASARTGARPPFFRGARAGREYVTGGFVSSLHLRVNPCFEQKTDHTETFFNVAPAVGHVPRNVTWWTSLR